MKNGFRQSMAWLHTWAGLVPGWVLFFMFLTGTAGYFDTEIDRWMQPERSFATANPPATEAVRIGLRRLERIAPDAQRWLVNLPRGRESPELRIFWSSGPGPDGERGASGAEVLDPETGAPAVGRDTGGGQLLYRMHYRLHYLPSRAAYWIAGIAAMVMLVAIVTGVIAHKKIFAEFFTFRPRKGQRSWLDAHNVAGVLALPFHVMIAYSGLVFFAYSYMAPVITATYGQNGQEAFFDELLGDPRETGRSGVAAPLIPVATLLARAEQRWGQGQVRDLEVRHPDDAHARVSIGQMRNTPLRRGETLVFDGTSGALLEIVPAVRSAPQSIDAVLLGLHEGLFAGPVLRWLYFLSSLLGTAMIATGLVLWTVKRRGTAGIAGQHSFGPALVERINVGVVAGLPIAIAAYFWANRLIPLHVDDRAAWEAHAMFIAWAIMLAHPMFRPVRAAWIEQLGFAAAAFGFLPLLNALTTQRHLGVSLPQGDWVMAGFDLTMLAFGLAFAGIAWVLTRKTRTARPGAGDYRRSEVTASGAGRVTE